MRFLISSSEVKIRPFSRAAREEGRILMLEASVAAVVVSAEEDEERLLQGQLWKTGALQFLRRITM